MSFAIIVGLHGGIRRQLVLVHSGRRIAFGMKIGTPMKRRKRKRRRMTGSRKRRRMTGFISEDSQLLVDSTLTLLSYLSG